MLNFIVDFGKIDILILLAMIPSIIIGLIVYKKDIVEKEPLSLLIKLFLVGALSTGIALFFEIYVEKFFSFFKINEVLITFIRAFIIIALCEEGIKWFLNYVICWNQKEFNYVYDAIVYTTFISLGFATTENIIAILSTNGGFILAIQRGLITVPAHAFFGIMSGYYLGMSKKYKNRGWIKKYRKNIILSILVPVLMHGLFDFLLFSFNDVYFLIIILFIMYLYYSSYTKIFKVSKDVKKISEE